MKFDLSSKVRFISCTNVRTWELAFQCIEEMYRHAYGSRAGAKLYADGLTPNEERLTRALVARFYDTELLSKSSKEPISVTCGDHEYVFVAIVPYEGPFVRYADLCSAGK